MCTLDSFRLAYQILQAKFARHLPPGGRLLRISSFVKNDESKFLNLIYRHAKALLTSCQKRFLYDLKSLRCLCTSVIRAGEQLPTGVAAHPSKGGQADQKIDIVGLNLCLVCRLISADLAAFFAAMNDDIAFFGIGFYLDRAQNTAARIRTVSGIDIHVQGAKATRTVIAGAVTQRLDGKPTVFTDEGVVVFCKSFLFHKCSP